MRFLLWQWYRFQIKKQWQILKLGCYRLRFVGLLILAVYGLAYLLPIDVLLLLALVVSVISYIWCIGDEP